MRPSGATGSQVASLADSTSSRWVWFPVGSKSSARSRVRDRRLQVEQQSNHGGWAMTDRSARAAPVAERVRLAETAAGVARWDRWGPYLAERQWGTVREDYSADGTAWDILPARPRPVPRLSLGRGRPARDQRRRGPAVLRRLRSGTASIPILKERLFGLTGPEGNHGEDVKEHYRYLDATPSHAYLKAGYRYPQRAFPYADLVEREPAARAVRARVRAGRHGRLRRRPLVRRPGRIRQGRGRGHPHPDLGDEPRAGSCGAPPPADALVPQHLVVGASPRPPGAGGGRLDPSAGRSCARTTRSWASTTSWPDGSPDLLFTENESNAERLWGGGECGAVRQGRDRRRPSSTAWPTGSTRAASGPRWRRTTADPGGRRDAGRSAATRQGSRPFARPGCRRRLRRADRGGGRVLRHAGGDRLTPDEALVQRQAFAGLIWSKQWYHLDVAEWLDGDPGLGPRRRRRVCTGATATGASSTPPTSCPCPTPGSTRGSRRGTSPSTACRWRCSTRPSPRTSWCS